MLPYQLLSAGDSLRIHLQNARLDREFLRGGGYISHPVLPHLSVLVEFDYRHQKIHIEPALFSAAMFSEGDLAERDVVAGLVLSFGRHHGK